MRGLIALVTLGTGLMANQGEASSVNDGNDLPVVQQVNAPDLTVVPVTLASVVVPLEEALVFIDPVGRQGDYARFGRPDIVVLTAVSPAHLSIETIIGMLRRDTVVLAPQEVIDQLPLMISNNTVAPFDVGTSQTVFGIRFTAIDPAASAPATARTVDRSRGDIGVVMEIDGLQLLF